MPQSKKCTLEVTQTVPGRVIRLPSGTYDVSEKLFPAPDMTYKQMIKMVPAGYRPSALEVVQYALQREKEFKKQGKNRRRVLDDMLFASYFGYTPKFERTGAFFMVPEGKKKIVAYIDKKDVKRYARGVRLGICDKIISDDVRLPLTQGGKVVEWNDIGIPAEISEGNEPHVWHLFVDEDRPKVGLFLFGDRYGGEYDRCLYFSAGWPPTSSPEDAAFRIVRGSVEDFKFPKAK